MLGQRKLGDTVVSMRTPRYKTAFLHFCKKHNVEVKTRKWPGANNKGFNASNICTPSTPSLRGSILFLHGAGTDRFFPSIQVQSEALKLGWQTICVDMDGHGGESTSAFNIQSSQNFLERVFNYISQEDLASPLNVLGVSMGGVMIAEYLAKNPENLVNKVATWSSPLEISPHIGSAFIEAVHGAHPCIWQHFFDYGLDIFPSMGPLRRKHLPFRSENNLSFVNSMIDTIKEKAKFLLTQKVKTPSLHLRGEFDQLCGATSLRKWAEVFEKCSRRTYANQSHASIAFCKQAREDTFKFFAL